MSKRTARKGWGFWDLTRYPHGGDFHRFTEDTVIEVLGTSHAKGYIDAVHADGRKISVHVNALRDEGSAE